jgi:transposase
VIGPTRQVRVFVYRDAVDMRKAYDTLSALVTVDLKKTLTSGDVFVFIGKTRRRAKALYFDGTGLCLFCKRLVTGVPRPKRHQAAMRSYRW